MTFYEFIVPVIFLALTGVGVFYIRWEGRKLDRKLEEEAAAKQSR